MSQSEPTLKPQCPHFGSGPTKKHPGWQVGELSGALVARSHRSVAGAERLQQVIDLTREVLEVPQDYHIAVMPGSATGAIESALWGLLGPRGVDVFAWDVFGCLWVTDVVEQLKLPDQRIFVGDFGKLPDLSQYDGKRDVVFTWNGTSAGVAIPHGEWIPDDREGLTICDATSSALCMPVRRWDKLDVFAFSWQKGLGGESGHGMLILGPRAIERLKTYTPTWPIPRLFRLANNKKMIEGIFEGKTINTPSMLCVEDAIKALEWAKNMGGQEGLWQRCLSNFNVIDAWIKNHSHLTFMAEVADTRSRSSVCLVFKPGVVTPERGAEVITSVSKTLADRGIAFEVKNHYLAPSSFRIWCGPTVEAEDIAKLLPWIDFYLQEYLKD